jgi:HNH endonuclease
VKTCTLPGCTDRHLAHGLCNRHLKRQRQYGDPLFALKPKKRAGETVIDGTGYVRVAGNRHLHRIVAEQALGRALRPGEIVHHKDGDKLNNDPSNLEVFASHAAHALHHATDRLARGIDNLNDSRRSRA